MVIQTYNNTAEVNRVDKSANLIDMGNITGTLRRECSLLKPNIDIQSATPPIFNYVYIPDFQRYYYVEEVTNINNNLWRVTFNCDVLMSYKNDIKKLTGIIARQEYEYNSYLVDTEIPRQNNSSFTYIEFPNKPFDINLSGNVYNFVLNVVGA